VRLSVFELDCTPPVGFPIGLGMGDTAGTVRDPLCLRGTILEEGAERCVVASLDYCALMNSAYDELRTALAEGADTPEDRVVVHCIHQHDTPLIDFEIEPYLGVVTFPRAWWRGLTARASVAARQGLERLGSVARVGHAETRLYGYASNRRILGPDGKVRGMRYSKCHDEALRGEPVGVIDPMLRTVAFMDAEGVLMASWSFYASHPQVANGRRMYSADAPGEAVRLVSDRMPSGLHAFFTGAGGNVTAGKYTSVTDFEENIRVFGGRLAEGMARNLTAMIWVPAAGMACDTAAFAFPARAVDRDALTAGIRDPATPAETKVVRAAVLSAAEYPRNRNYTLTRLALPGARILFVPGEPFVEYQLYVQSLAPDEFVAVAANCSDNFLYLPMAKHFAEGGYEPTSFCWCTGEFETAFKQAVRDLL